MKIKKKVLIVGLGNIGLHYDLKKNNKLFKLSHSNCFSQHNFFDLQGAVDKKINNLKLFHKKYGKNIFSNLKKALNFISPEIIVVSTTSKTHLSVIKDIFKNSKPELILCEKPLSNNYIDALKIYKLCIKNNCKLLVNYSRRYDSYLLKIKNFLKKNAKTRLLCNIYYSKGLLNNGSHFLNLSEYLFGKLIKVKILKRNNFLKDYTINFYAKFKYADVNFINTQNLFTSNYFEIFSDKYLIRSNQNIIYYYKIEKDKLYNKLDTLSNVKKNLTKINPDLVNFNVVNEVSNFIKGKKSFVCTGKEAVQTMKNLQFIISHE
jgi:predicted dehydrogenase